MKTITPEEVSLTVTGNADMTIAFAPNATRPAKVLITCTYEVVLPPPGSTEKLKAIGFAAAATDDPSCCVRTLAHVHGAGVQNVQSSGTPLLHRSHPPAKTVSTPQTSDASTSQAPAFSSQGNRLETESAKAVSTAQESDVFISQDPPFPRQVHRLATGLAKTISTSQTSDASTSQYPALLRQGDELETESKANKIAILPLPPTREYARIANFGWPQSLGAIFWILLLISLMTLGQRQPTSSTCHVTS